MRRKVAGSRERKPFSEVSSLVTFFTKAVRVAAHKYRRALAAGAVASL